MDITCLGVLYFSLGWFVHDISKGLILLFCKIFKLEGSSSFVQLLISMLIILALSIFTNIFTLFQN